MVPSCSLTRLLLLELSDGLAHSVAKVLSHGMTRSSEDGALYEFGSLFHYGAIP